MALVIIVYVSQEVPAMVGKHLKTVETELKNKAQQFAKEIKAANAGARAKAAQVMVFTVDYSVIPLD